MGLSMPAAQACSDPSEGGVASLTRPRQRTTPSIHVARAPARSYRSSCCANLCFSASSCLRSRPRCHRRCRGGRDGPHTAQCACCHLTGNGDGNARARAARHCTELVCPRACIWQACELRAAVAGAVPATGTYAHSARFVVRVIAQAALACSSCT